MWSEKLKEVVEAFEGSRGEWRYGARGEMR
jgi:hypothetical protein